MDQASVLRLVLIEAEAEVARSYEQGEPRTLSDVYADVARRFDALAESAAEAGE